LDFGKFLVEYKVRALRSQEFFHKLRIFGGVYSNLLKLLKNFKNSI